MTDEANRKPRSQGGESAVKLETRISARVVTTMHGRIYDLIALRWQSLPSNADS
jgi:hypothetical protein